MADGKRDGNNDVVLMAVSSVDGVTPVPLKCDPITGRLLCVFNSSDGGNATPVRTDAKLDGNGNKTALVITTDVTPLRIPLSSHNGALMIQAN